MAEDENDPTLIARLCRQIKDLSRATARPAPDAEMLRRVGDLYSAVTRLAQAPATDPAELLLKIEVLCRRLREDLDPLDRGSALTHLLAASIRDDCRALPSIANDDD